MNENDIKIEKLRLPAEAKLPAAGINQPYPYGLVSLDFNQDGKYHGAPLRLVI